MADDAVNKSIVEALEDVLSNSSETLTTYATDPKTDTTPTVGGQSSTIGAPLRTPENDPNFKLWQEAFERTGDENVMVQTELTPETISAAANLLVQSPEFKDYIGQYALSNDVNTNIETLSQAINSQKKYAEGMSREIDGDFFKTKDAYFLQRILENLKSGVMTEDFFKELRDKVNSEFLAKNESEKSTIPLTSEEQEPDALQKVAKLLEQREGEIVEDATTDEKFDELKRMFGTPEYKQAQIEDIGYDPEVGHPDPEIKEYLKAKAEWAKQSWREQGPEPKKPENYEQRLKQPKIDYDNRRNQETLGLTPEPTKSIETYETLQPQKTEQTTSLFQLPTQAQETSLIKGFEPLLGSTIESSVTNEETLSLADIVNLLDTQTTEIKTSESLPTFKSEETKSLKVQSDLPREESWASVKTNDELSENILSNTEKTNTMMEGLVGLLTTYLQTSMNNQGMNAPQQPQLPSMPSSNSTSLGSTDLIKSLEAPNLIADIRSKF